LAFVYQLARCRGSPAASIAQIHMLNSGTLPLLLLPAGVSGNVKFDPTGDLIPDDTTYQRVTYKAGKPVVGATLPLGAS
jgi:hypothetical protein